MASTLVLRYRYCYPKRGLSATFKGASIVRMLLCFADGSVAAMTEYHQLEQIIPITNAAIKSLEGVKNWWSSRSMVEKRMTLFRTELVVRHSLLTRSSVRS